MRREPLLIVDDDPEFLKTMAAYFRKEGYAVSTAVNMDEALQAFKRKKPRVVLLDFKMPLVTGEKLLPMFQSLNPMVRVIVITGYAHEEVEERFKGLGYFAFFEKAGLSLEKLKEKVEEAMRY